MGKAFQKVADRYADIAVLFREDEEIEGMGNVRTVWLFCEQAEPHLNDIEARGDCFHLLVPHFARVRQAWLRRPAIACRIKVLHDNV